MSSAEPAPRDCAASEKGMDYATVRRQLKLAALAWKVL
jgi:hypothetical protein